MWGRVIAAAGVSGVALVSLLPAAHATSYNEMFGTGADDIIRGTGGADFVRAHRGKDTIRPLRGADIVHAGRGDDRIFLRNDGQVDRVHCGRGSDLVAWRHTVDQHDLIDPNCEVLIA